METILDEHQACAGVVQEESRQQVEFHYSERREAGGRASSTWAAEGIVTGDSWGQDVEDEYINIKEAVDADLLNYDDAGAAAAECSSSSSDDEAAAEEEASMTEETSSDIAMDTITAHASSSAATSRGTGGESVVSTTAFGDRIDLSTANSAACSTAGQSYRVTTSLEIVLKGARDAICSAAVGTTSMCGTAPTIAEQQHQQVEPVLLAALGSCDDACRVYVLPPATHQQQQRRTFADASASHSASTAGSSNISISRSRQKRTARQGMEAAATLREGHETISAAAFSFDSKLLACGCFDGVVRVYRPRVTRASGTGKTPTPPSCGRRGLDKTRSASPRPRDGAVLEPERPETTTQQEREADSAAHTTAPLAEREEKASSEEQVELSVELVEELRGCAVDVVDLSFHPRGYALIVASADQTAWVWLLPVSLVSNSNVRETAGARRAAVLAVYAAAAPLTCCSFSSSGREGIVGAADGTVSVFTAKTGALLYAVKHPGLSLSLRQRLQPQPQEPCSVVTLRLSSMCVTQPAFVKAGTCGSARGAVGESACGSVPAAVGPCVSADDGTALKTDSSTNEREQHEDVLLGVGYEDGWVALVRAATGDVIFAEQGHAQKAVESIAFVRVAAGTRTTAARAATAGSGCCYLFASGALDGRVVIWDVAHKCVRAALACVAASVAEPDPAVAGAAALQRDLMAAAGVTRLLVLRGSLLNVCDMHAGLQQGETSHELQWLQQQQMRELRVQQQEQQDAVLLCAGTTDGHLFVMDVRAGQLLLHWQAHAGAVMDLTALPAAGATLAKEQGAVAVPPARADGEGWPSLSPQNHEFHRCCCCWRVLSAGDDGMGKVWRIFCS